MYKLIVTVLVLLLTISNMCQAQLLKKLKDKANEKVEATKNKAVQKAKDRVSNKEAKADAKVDSTMDSGLDKVENVLKKKDKTKTKKTETQADEAEQTNGSETNTQTNITASNYDREDKSETPKRNSRETDPEQIFKTIAYTETADKNSPANPNLLQFVKDKEYIQRVSLPIVENLAKQINSSKYILQVIVYTSDTSSTAQKLSVKRAASIIKYLQYFYKTPNDKIFNTRLANNGNKEYNKGDKENDNIEIIMIKTDK